MIFVPAINKLHDCHEQIIYPFHLSMQDHAPKNYKIPWKNVCSGPLQIPNPRAGGTSSTIQVPPKKKTKSPNGLDLGIRRREVFIRHGLGPRAMCRLFLCHVFCGYGRANRTVWKKKKKKRFHCLTNGTKYNVYSCVIIVLSILMHASYMHAQVTGSFLWS